VCEICLQVKSQSSAEIVFHIRERHRRGAAELRAPGRGAPRSAVGGAPERELRQRRAQRSAVGRAAAENEPQCGSVLVQRTAVTTSLVQRTSAKSESDTKILKFN
jgi:hypothetical protein